MKNASFILLSGIIMFFAASAISWKDVQKTPDMPEDVLKILSVTCYNCHTKGSKSADAVKAVNFDEWNDLKPAKKIGTLSKIKVVIEKGQMPPKKFLEKHPEKVLAVEDQKVLLDWTADETSKLME